MFTRIEEKSTAMDYITISACCSPWYVASLEEMKKEAIYNRIRRVDYSKAEDYLKDYGCIRKDYKGSAQMLQGCSGCGISG